LNITIPKVEVRQAGRGGGEVHRTGGAEEVCSVRAGAPVGYRLAVRHPERLSGLVVQNDNAFEEGLDNDFWKPLKAYWQDRSEKNAEPLRKFLTLEATR
jgi:hypothetical protein